MHLWKALRHLYPTADPLRDYRLQDDGSGTYIRFWNTAILGPQPTDAQITAAIADYDAAQAAKTADRTALRDRLSALTSSTTALTNTQRDQALRDLARAVIETGGV